MSGIIIRDLAFCETEPIRATELQGGGTLNGVAWGSFFTFAFAHDNASKFAYGTISAYGIAFGNIILGFGT